MLVAASSAWSQRPGHRLKSEEGRRRAALLGLEDDRGLVLEALRRRKGPAEVAFAPNLRVEVEFHAEEKDGELRPWLAVLDLRGVPAGTPKEGLMAALRGWLRQVREDPGAILEVGGVRVRVHPVTAYPVGR